ncbi:MAG: GntR family transcriptional regulator [Clostridia bacterium]|nr:GntR family transcriptional regulator [Clostridia bacterium]
MFKLDYADGKPIYEQIKDNFKQLIIEGVLKPDDRIPSVRELAISMAINPNTIQKAYKELEFEGYVYSVRAKGVFVASLENIALDKNTEKLYKNLEDAVRELYFVGEDKAKLIDAIEKIYERGNNHD